MSDNIFLWIFLSGTFAAAIPATKRKWSKGLCFVATVIFTVLAILELTSK